MESSNICIFFCFIYRLGSNGDGECYTSFVCKNTERRTDTMSVFFVKEAVEIPRRPLSCWRAMVMAAPAMNPTMAACDR